MPRSRSPKPISAPWLQEALLEVPVSDAGPAPQPHSPRGAIRNQRPMEIGRAVLLKVAMTAEETECFEPALISWGQHVMVAARETQCCISGQIGDIGVRSDCAKGVLLQRCLEHVQISQHLFHCRLVERSPYFSPHPSRRMRCTSPIFHHSCRSSSGYAMSVHRHTSSPQKQGPL